MDELDLRHLKFGSSFGSAGIDIQKFGAGFTINIP